MPLGDALVQTGQGLTVQTCYDNTGSAQVGGAMSDVPCQTTPFWACGHVYQNPNIPGCNSANIIMLLMWPSLSPCSFLSSRNVPSGHFKWQCRVYIVSC